MTDEDPQAVIGEFLVQMNDVAGVHGMALFGAFQIHAVAMANEPVDRTPESSFFIGHGDPNTPEGFAYQRWRYDELDEKLASDGPVARALGQQWVVMVASLWNDHFRERLAVAKGMKKNEVEDPCLADINRMRNDIIHHGGVATARNSGRCEVLRWFSDGDIMHVYPAHVAEFMHYLGLVETTEGIGGGPWEPRDE